MSKVCYSDAKYIVTNMINKRLNARHEAIASFELKAVHVIIGMLGRAKLLIMSFRILVASTPSIIGI